jgi:Raf kinase inhibitor-like YbhB/YbcL family protein
MNCRALAGSLGIVQAFELSSLDIAKDKPIAQKFAFSGFGCTGENLSPALAWKEGAKRFAIFAHDPDAKTGGAGFWYWVAIDTPAMTMGLPQGAGAEVGKKLPAGSKLITSDFGPKSYDGPCPPQGDASHHMSSRSMP